MLTQRLLKFLHYNIQQYIELRSLGRYQDAVERLQKMAKLTLLIEKSGDTVTPEDATLIERVRLHVTALGILTSS